MSNITNSIEAKFVSGTDEEYSSGLAKFACPVCKKEVIERDLVKYWPKNEKVTVEICHDCETDYENDSGNTLDADIIEDDLFESLHQWVVENLTPDPEKPLEDRMKAIADALNGNLWQSGGGIWVVICRKKDGKVVVISDESVCEYENEDAFENSKPTRSINLI